MLVSVELRGPWSFRRSPNGGGAVPPTVGDLDDWMPATVPGCVHTDLLAGGKIADPFSGENEADLQWIDAQDWIYRTSFDAAAALLARERVDLLWKGLDTYADVVLNGRTIVRAHNMFREWRADVTPLLARGENSLLVHLRSPIAEVMPAHDRLGYVLPATNDQANPMVSMYTRKAPYHYGWDWGPRFVTSGIWRPVVLVAWDAARIDHVQIVQSSLDERRATLRVRATVIAARPGRGRLRAGIAHEGPRAEAEVEVFLEQGTHVLETTLTIERPRRWWPNGLGAAHLYAIECTLAMDDVVRDARTTRVGLRTIEVVHRPDADGKAFTVCVNDAPVFMKGANYIPSDSFPTRVTSERHRSLVRAAADANMNMLRVWGGGIYEDDRFYDDCDELGILVWQDFMFACSMYPGDSTFLENVREEATENVRRLRNHPCLALWSGNNEIEAAWMHWGWQEKYGLSERTQDAIARDYRRIFYELLPGIVAAEDPGRFYTRSSPSANDDAIAPNSLGKGDMHYWGVWHGEEPYEKYAEHVSRFMSEYGFQSFPELSTVARYASPADFRIDSPVMLAHQRHPRGNQLISTYLERDFRTPKDFAAFLYVSQVLQATIVGFAARAHRRQMPYCGGSLYWQLDDCWPVASWSGIDYFGRWKALHHHARHFFAPILVSTTRRAGHLETFVVSDRRVDTPLRLLLRLLELDGRERWRSERSTTATANGSALHHRVVERELLAGADPARVVFVAEAYEADRLSRDLTYFVPSRDLALEDPLLDVQVVSGPEGTTVRVTARKLARAVRLSADGDEGRFADNYFDLLPGETAVVAWEGPPLRAVRAISLRDTY